MKINNIIVPEEFKNKEQLNNLITKNEENVKFVNDLFKLIKEHCFVIRNEGEREIWINNELYVIFKN